MFTLNPCRLADKHPHGVYDNIFRGKMDPLEYGDGVIALYDDVPKDWQQSEKQHLGSGIR